jgi:Fe-S-cluster-containing dehydrogenase component
MEPQGVYVPMFCQRCEDAPCIDACPSVAITHNAATGAIEIDPAVCVLCEACVTACSYMGIHRDEIGQTVIACDLCGGDPTCVRSCETKAIQFLERDPAAAQKREESLQLWREQLTMVEQSVQPGVE